MLIFGACASWSTGAGKNRVTFGAHWLPKGEDLAWGRPAELALGYDTMTMYGVGPRSASVISGHARMDGLALGYCREQVFGFLPRLILGCLTLSLGLCFVFILLLA